MPFTTNKNVCAGSVVATTATAYYTAGSTVRSKITKMTCTNVTGGDQTLKTWLVQSGDSTADANTILYSEVVPAGKCLEIYQMEGHVLNPSGKVYALASASGAINIVISAVETTI